MSIADRWIPIGTGATPTFAAPDRAFAAPDASSGRLVEAKLVGPDGIGMKQMKHMRIDILSAVPRLLDSWFNESILQRAQQKGLVEIKVHDLREHSTDKHRRLDDYPFGGGAGMVMTIEPIHRCISGLKAERAYDEVIYMSPDGEMLDQPLANRLSTLKNLIILCGHYKGVDERVREHLITREVSIGNYVLSGGEIPAAVLSDAVIRLLPGVLGDETSALSDSFQDGLVAPPVYTRPSEYNGWGVPEVLLSGHEAKIHAWRHEQSLVRTHERRKGMSGLGDD